jgi:ribosomal-protein-alanine N-acetyltransferase
MNTPNAVRISEHLELRPFSWSAVAAVVADDRQPDWAHDYPDTGDRVITRLLHQAIPPEPYQGGPWGHYQVVERPSGTVVGGIGFKIPPEDGVTEIGYGIVPSRQRHGYATEAVQAILAVAWENPEINAVTANTAMGNIASQRVLGKAGFAYEGNEADEKHFRIDRPASGC